MTSLRIKFKQNNNILLSTSFVRQLVVQNLGLNLDRILENYIKLQDEDEFIEAQENTEVKQIAEAPKATKSSKKAKKESTVDNSFGPKVPPVKSKLREEEYKKKYRATK